jgi:hypothetical protein
MTLDFNLTELKSLSDALDEYVYQLDRELDYARDYGENDNNEKLNAASAVHDRIYDALAGELEK